MAGTPRLDYTQSSACPLGPMEGRAQALRKPVIPRHPRESGEEAGIHSIESPWIPATRFRGQKLLGNDGLI